MWIVVRVVHCYPSVEHFSTEEEARKVYEEWKAKDFTVHLAEVKDTQINHDDLGKEYNNPKDLDVVW